MAFGQENLSHEETAVSSNLTVIKDKSSLHKFSYFTCGNNNLKGSKNFEYSIDLGLTEKFSLRYMLFSTSFNLYQKSLNINLLGS